MNSIDEKLTEIKNTKKDLDFAWDEMIKLSVNMNNAEKELSSFKIHIYSFQAELAKFSTERATEDQVVDKFCQLGDLTKEKDRLEEVYTEARKRYAEKTKEVEILKKKLEKLKENFWKDQGVSRF